MENRDIMYVWEDTDFEEDISEIIACMVWREMEKEDIVGYVLDVAERQPVLYKNFDMRSLMEMVDSVYADDRYDENGDISDTLQKVFLKYIDFEGLTKDLEKVCLYYPQGEEYTITEQDWEDYNK